MKLSDLNILSIGNTIQMVGAVYAGEGKMVLALFPEDQGRVLIDEGEVWFRPAEATTAELELEVDVLDMNLADWETFVRQTDVLETEVLSKASDGTLAKIILRKSTRQIESGVQWKVFKRDGYRCRYCGNDDCPLTVDHLILWEEGGPSTTDNLVAACKKCNKVRGNTAYEEWLKHPRYLDQSKNLTPEVRALNEELIGKIRFIPRRLHARSR